MRDRPNDHHRHVIPVPAGHVVDHINEDKADSTPANLRTMTRGEHTTQHNKARGLSKLRSALRMVKEGRKLY